MNKKSQQLIAVSAGHFTLDFYMNLVPPILFAFSNAMGLNLTQQSVVSFVMITCGSLFQPIIGHILDKTGKSSYLIISIIWISFMMSMTGLVTNYFLLIITVALASISSSIYHPLGSTIAVNLSKNSKGKSLSIFLAVGGFASTFTPMISIPIVNKFGLAYLSFLMIPGFIVAYLLKFFEIDKIKCSFRKDKKNQVKKAEKTSKNKAKWLSFLVFMASIRVVFQRMIIIFGVQLMIMKGIGIISAGVILSAHMFLRTLGTLSGGYLSDRFGERRILIIFSLLSFGIYTMMIFARGAWVAIGIIILGYAFNGSTTANITITHHLLPNDINLGTGTIIGIPGTIGSILLLVFGKFADIYGLIEIAQISAIFCLIPVFISVYLSKNMIK